MACSKRGEGKVQNTDHSMISLRSNIGYIKVCSIMIFRNFDINVTQNNINLTKSQSRGKCLII